MSNEKREQQMMDAADSYPNWISVEDELPPKNGKTQQSIGVWATDGLTSGEFRYNFDTKTWTDMWGDPFDITHWMQLPKLPRKEDKKMIVQEDVPYTKEEVKAMVKTIHDLREKLSLMDWHPASELPQLDKNGGSDLVYALGKVFSKGFGEYIDKVPCRVRVIHGKWAPEDIEVEWWCYPPKED